MTSHEAQTRINFFQLRAVRVPSFDRQLEAWKNKINRRQRRRKLIEIGVAALVSVAVFGAVAGEWILLAMK